MLYLGCHLSSSKGYAAMGRTALSIGANTFQFFTRNPRGGTAKAPDPDDVAELRRIAREHAFGPLVAHAPYTYNLCSAKERAREFALEGMREDLERIELLPGTFYNFHPGAHVGQGMERGIERIAEALGHIMFEGQSTRVLLETMAGKGTEVGGRFEDLARIIALVEERRPELAGNLRVCLDTCHVSDAGYDIAGDPDGVLREFNEIIGLERLHALHINDSMNPVGAHKDRHARIGEGCIGYEALQRFVNHPLLKGLLAPSLDQLLKFGGAVRLRCGLGHFLFLMHGCPSLSAGLSPSHSLHNAAPAEARPAAPPPEFRCPPP